MSPTVILLLRGLSRLSPAERSEFVSAWPDRRGRNHGSNPTDAEVRKALGALSGDAIGTATGSGCPCCGHVDVEAAAEHARRSMPKPSSFNDREAGRADRAR